MPFRTEPWPPGTPCWLDVTTPDLAGAKDLYGRAFGWALADQGEEFGNYVMASVDGHAAAGIGPLQQPQAPPAWLVYVSTDDIDATLRAVQDNGGTVHQPRVDIPGTGSMAVVADPGAGVFGLYQAGGHNGATVYNRPGTFVWCDTNVGDVARAKAFYTAVFGWDYQPVEGGGRDYVTYARPGGEALGGLGDLSVMPPGTPSHWLPYFGVTDTDAAVATFTAAGGEVVSAPVDTPFGRMAVVRDPWGATLSLISVPAEDAAPA